MPHTSHYGNDCLLTVRREKTGAENKDAAVRRRTLLFVEHLTLVYNLRAERESTMASPMSLTHMFAELTSLDDLGAPLKGSSRVRVS